MSSGQEAIGNLARISSHCLLRTWINVPRLCNNQLQWTYPDRDPLKEWLAASYRPESQKASYEYCSAFMHNTGPWSPSFTGSGWDSLTRFQPCSRPLQHSTRCTGECFSFSPALQSLGPGLRRSRGPVLQHTCAAQMSPHPKSLQN